MELKICRVCQVASPIDEFVVRPDTGKRRTECRGCKQRQDRDYSRRNSAVGRERAKQWYYDNRPTVLHQRAVERVEKADEIKARKREEYRNHREKYIARARAREYHLFKFATPKWLSSRQKAEIKSWYNLAKELQWLAEEPLHVDHIIPLQGENVSGLHVPWNLQILPRSENLRKGRKA